MTAYCPHCEAMEEMREVLHEDTLRVRGEPITVQTLALQCLRCATIISDPTHDEQTLQEVYALYRTRHSLLTPDEIRELRERYGLSQRALARLLGWGLVTIQRYEAGALQDPAHDAVLRRLSDPQEVLRLVTQAGDRLSAAEQMRVHTAALGMARAEAPQNIARAVERAILWDAARNPLDYGFQRFSLDRLGLVVCWLAQACERLFKTKLAKLLWLADFAAFRLHRVSLTGLAYARLPYGPVPDQFSLVLAALESLQIVAVVPDEAGEFSGERVEPRLTVDLHEFSPPERFVLDWVVRQFGDDSASELSRLSHAETMWRDHKDGDRLPYPDADTLRLLDALPFPGE